MKMKTRKLPPLCPRKSSAWLFYSILFFVLATHSGISSAQCEIADLGGLNGGVESTGFRVSADGKVVVGWARDGAAKGAIRAFRWTREEGMQSLGNLNGGWRSFALDTNADGSVVVGYATDGTANNQRRAFRWEKASGMQVLGVFPGTKYPASASSYAYGISDDGSVITGYASKV